MINPGHLSSRVWLGSSESELWFSFLPVPASLFLENPLCMGGTKGSEEQGDDLQRETDIAPFLHFWSLQGNANPGDFSGFQFIYGHALYSTCPYQLEIVLLVIKVHLLWLISLPPGYFMAPIVVLQGIAILWFYGHRLPKLKANSIEKSHLELSSVVCRARAGQLAVLGGLRAHRMVMGQFV